MPENECILVVIIKIGRLVQTCICITSLDAGKIPQDLKDAYIVTLLNKGDHSNCNKYQSISLLSTVCKVYGRILL